MADYLQYLCSPEYIGHLIETLLGSIMLVLFGKPFLELFTKLILTVLSVAFLEPTNTKNDQIGK